MKTTEKFFSRSSLRSGRFARLRTAVLGAAAMFVSGGIMIGATALEAAPKKGGTIIVALGAEPNGINSVVTSSDPDVYTGCLVYDALVRINNKYDVEPALAKSWDISDDGLKYTFHLVDAKWSDGKPLTSADAKFSLEEVSSQYGGRFSGAKQAISSIEAPDPKTLVINLQKPFGPMLFSLACDNNAAILPAHVFQGTDILQNPANANPSVVSGPFKMEKWVRGDHIVFVRNPDYWRKDRPYLDRLIVKLMPDSSARILALQAGEIDQIHQYYFPISSYASFEGDKRFKLVEGNFPGLDMAILNTKKPPLDDVAVRRALLVAMDREYIWKTVFFGTGQPGQGAFDTRIEWSYNPDVKYDEMYPHDVEKAKKMLDDAGHKAGADGVRFKLRIIFDTNRPEMIAWAQALREQWRAVGIDVALEGAERPVVLKRAFNDYDYDVTLQNYTTAGDPALGIARSYVSSSINPKRTFNNVSQYSNPEVDELFAKGRSAATTEERAKAYYKVQEILARDVPVLVVHQRASIYAGIAELKDYWLGGGYPWWSEAWLDK